ncbi:MAG: hypothetical protein D3914_17225 [Candidatus Electrothrix sp. LOE2]|nr:hypothetical protein [Candidatus Electrothrix sp. LOE2]
MLPLIERPVSSARYSVESAERYTVFLQIETASLRIKIRSCCPCYFSVPEEIEISAAAASTISKHSSGPCQNKILLFPVLDFSMVTLLSVVRRQRQL